MIPMHHFQFQRGYSTPTAWVDLINDILHCLGQTKGEFALDTLNLLLMIAKCSHMGFDSLIKFYQNFPKQLRTICSK